VCGSAQLPWRTVQWDTRHTRGWKIAGDRMYLIALIDDATSTLFARFVPTTRRAPYAGFGLM